MTLRAALFGVSGVGKTHLLSEMKKSYLIKVVSASQLIKEEIQITEGVEVDDDILRSRDIDSNQELLISRFLSLSFETNQPIVFDSHSVVDTDNGIIQIPSIVFSSIGINQVFFLWACPRDIFQRRSNDQIRSRPHRDENSLRTLQNTAFSASQRISSEIGCNTICLSSERPDPLIRALRI